MPKLIASDLDGTLIRSDGTVSDRTVAALARADAAGATLVMVTGRPPRWMHEISERLDHRGVAICANGAVLYDLAAERILARHTIPPDTIADVVARLRAVRPELRFAVEYGETFVYEARFNLGTWDAEAFGGRPADEEALVATPATKILALHPRTDMEALVDDATKAVGDLVTITHSSHRALLEISAQGVTKATALADYCLQRGLTSADVMAFGDMPNDLPMLTWAGRPYAMANAHPDVLAIVPDHTLTNNEDGVAAVLERYFP